MPAVEAGVSLLSMLVNTLVSLVPQFVSRFLTDESGATAIEYGLIAALIAVVIIVAVTSIGTKLGAIFDSIEFQVDDSGADTSG